MTDTNTTTANADAPNQALSAGSIERPLGRVVLDKVQRSALGAALTKPEIAETGLQATGCLVALILWASGLAKEGAATLWIEESDALAALSRRGIAFGDDARMLRSMELAGAIVRANGLVSIPALDAALSHEGQKQVNRKKGWEKRGGGHSPEDGLVSRPQQIAKPQLIPATGAKALEPKPARSVYCAEPATAPLLGAKPFASGVQTSLVPETERCAPSPAASKGRKSVDDVLRGPKEVDPTPVAVEVPLSGDKVGAVSAGYVAYLQETFAGVDALAQVKLAAAWSQAQPAKRKTRAGLARFLTTWLMSAQREASMRKTISRAASARNGFGQGGESLIAIDRAATPALGDDDFSDLQDASAAVAVQPQVTRQAVPAPAVLAATNSSAGGSGKASASTSNWRTRFNRAGAPAAGVAA